MAKSVKAIWSLFTCGGMWLNGRNSLYTKNKAIFERPLLCQFVTKKFFFFSFGDVPSGKKPSFILFEYDHFQTRTKAFSKRKFAVFRDFKHCVTWPKYP